MPAGDRHPFEYPMQKHIRRHSPSGFVDYKTFKEYLRDEFLFTCVYCLCRETWNIDTAFFGVEHYKPKSKTTDAEIVEYANLLYACNVCNSAKRDNSFPESLNPEKNPYGVHLAINRNGEIHALSKDGERLVLMLCLDSPKRTRWRRIHYDILEEALSRPSDAKAQKQLSDFFGFPEALPDIRKRKGANNPYCGRSRPNWF